MLELVRCCVLMWHGGMLLRASGFLAYRQRCRADGSGWTRWRSPATDAASAPASVQSPFSAPANQQRASQQGVLAGYYPSTAELSMWRRGGIRPEDSAPSVASAPSLLQSGPQQRDYSMSAGLQPALASPTWSDGATRGASAGGGDGGPRDGDTPGRKRPRTQFDPDDARAGAGSPHGADPPVRASVTPRSYG